MAPGCMGFPGLSPAVATVPELVAGGFLWELDPTVPSVLRQKRGLHLSFPVKKAISSADPQTSSWCCLLLRACVARACERFWGPEPTPGQLPGPWAPLELLRGSCLAQALGEAPFWKQVRSYLKSPAPYPQSHKCSHAYQTLIVFPGLRGSGVRVLNNEFGVSQ